jgi:hypothetical protein
MFWGSLEPMNRDREDEHAMPSTGLSGDETSCLHAKSLKRDCKITIIYAKTSQR